MAIITQNHIAEGAALVVSLLCWPKIKKGKLKTLPFFLAFILLVELTGSYLSRVIRINNVWLYNFSIPLEYAYCFFLFWLHSGQLLKRIIQFCWVILLAVGVYYFIKEPINQFHSYVLVAGELLVVMSFCIYIYKLFDEAEDFPLWKRYFFWMASGLFLFNLGEMVYFVLHPLIRSNDWDRLNFWFKTINNNLLLFLYLSYAISCLIYYKYASIKTT